ncbi:MAG: hypothetical protein ACWGSD_11220, partial [Thermodesulfobacteriota bacterium]
MKPRFEKLKALCPDVDPRLVEEHLSRLNERYFERFSVDDIREHLDGLSRLSAERPVDLHIREKGHHEVYLTVLGFDYLGVFSLMTGILAGMGFNISSGDVFTYRRREEKSGPPGQHRGRTQSRRKKDALSRRRIVNHFSGSWTREFRFEEWVAELEKRICAIFALLEEEDSPSAEQARHQVNEMVAKELDHFQPDRSPALSPVLIEVDNESGECTRLKIVSEDTPAFLYSLTQAFSLH